MQDKVRNTTILKILDIREGQIASFTLMQDNNILGCSEKILKLTDIFQQQLKKKYTKNSTHKQKMNMSKMQLVKRKRLLE